MVRESRVGKSKDVPIVSMYYKAVPREMKRDDVEKKCQIYTNMKLNLCKDMYSPEPSCYLGEMKYSVAPSGKSTVTITCLQDGSNDSSHMWF